MILDLLEHTLRSKLLEEGDVHNLDLVVLECLKEKGVESYLRKPVHNIEGILPFSSHREGP